MPTKRSRPDPRALIGGDDDDNADQFDWFWTKLTDDLHVITRSPARDYSVSHWSLVYNKSEKFAKSASGWK